MKMEPWMKPMLCGESVKPDALGRFKDYAAEIKWDGWRFAGYREGDDLRIFTGRDGNEHTGQLPYLEEELLGLLPPDTCVDGELLSPLGHQAIATAMNRKESHVPSPGSPALSLVLFDVLMVSKTDVRIWPWKDRRALLEKIPVKAEGLVKRSVVVPATRRALDNAIELGIEGLVFKRKSSRYISGRSSAWVKCKPTETLEGVVTGFVPGKGSITGLVGALEFVVLDDQGRRTDVKSSCSGFSMKLRREITERFEEDWLGTVIEVRHLGRYPNGVPRSPQHHRRRDDRKVAA